MIWVFIPNGIQYVSPQSRIPVISASSVTMIFIKLISQCAKQNGNFLRSSTFKTRFLINSLYFVMVGSSHVIYFSRRGMMKVSMNHDVGFLVKIRPIMPPIWPANLTLFSAGQPFKSLDNQSGSGNETHNIHVGKVDWISCDAYRKWDYFAEYLVSLLRILFMDRFSTELYDNKWAVRHCNFYRTTHHTLNRTFFRRLNLFTKVSCRGQSSLFENRRVINQSKFRGVQCVWSVVTGKSSCRT